MDMPWTRARDLLAAIERADRRRTAQLAVAARAARMDNKPWGAWLSGLLKEE